MIAKLDHPNDLLTESQAAKILTVSRQTLAIWRCQGRTQPRYIRLSPRLIRYRRADLDAFIAARACEQLQAPSDQSHDHTAR